MYNKLILLVAQRGEGGKRQNNVKSCHLRDPVYPTYTTVSTGFIARAPVFLFRLLPPTQYADEVTVGCYRVAGRSPYRMLGIKGTR